MANVRQQTGCSDTQVWEALWGLVGEGLIYLDTAGQQSSTDNWRWCLSADGRKVVKGGTWEPRDPEGYLARIRREVPDLDGLVELYLVEVLLSFNGRCYLATSVMLGVAAEIAKELAKPRGNYFTLWTEFRKRIEPIRQDLPNGLADALTLDAIADLIRTTRNEVGHPTGRRIDEDTARVHLTIAPVYLRKMQMLSALFAGTPTGASA